MVIYGRPPFKFTELDAAFDVVIAECEARECECHSVLCVVNTHVGSHLDMEAVIDDILQHLPDVAIKRFIDDEA